MKHSKRRRLTSEDFNKALGTSSTEVKLMRLSIEIPTKVQDGQNYCPTIITDKKLGTS